MGPYYLKETLAEKYSALLKKITMYLTILSGSKKSIKGDQKYSPMGQPHAGQCKHTGRCYNELVVAIFSTGSGAKGKKNLYLLTLSFIYKLAFILFVMTPGTQTIGNIAVYGSAKQLVI